MTDEGPSVLDYNATLNRMEPGVAPVGIEQSLASIAISLKNISTKLDAIETNALVIQGTLNFNLQNIQASLNGIAGNITMAANQKR